LENDENCPSAHLCQHFIKGDIRDLKQFTSLVKELDAITIEIENVSIDALEKLEQEGVKVYPKPSVLKIIKNKILQKAFYKEHSIPSAPFVITQSLSDLYKHEDFLPAVHKIGEGGYDGKGVQILITKEDLDFKGFDAPSVLEKKINIRKEIAQMIAIDNDGKTALYPPVEMIFNPNLESAGLPALSG
jgi:5-(carboxyamino)imidazole ribonucleotide synthase